MSTDHDAPAKPSIAPDFVGRQHFGLTAREHAAIALRVPDSGNDWLDAMICTAQRNELAARAVASYLSRDDVKGHQDDYAKMAFVMADAMLSAAATQRAEGE